MSRKSPWRSIKNDLIRMLIKASDNRNGQKLLDLQTKVYRR
jgi:hypothetical protein